jgi:ABC-2 type transport system permease protein
MAMNREVFMLNLLIHELRLRRGAIIGWGIGLALFAMLYMVVYAQLPPEMTQINLADIPFYQAFGNMDMSTFESYLSSTLFNFFPLLLGIYAIVNGTGTLAGEEDEGTLELLVAMPLPRWQLVLVKALAMAISLLLILLITAAGVWLSFASIQADIDTDITAVDLLRMTLNSWPIIVVFMMISLFLGAFLPNRRTAAMVATVILVVSYLGNNLAPLVESLQPLQPLFPFYYYDGSVTAFTVGIETADVLMLLATAVVFLLLAVASFQRRNITVGAWPWQRARLEG